MNIVFWSYKGGSGRSICAANVAVKLAEYKRVGLIDFDLEAPGLHTIFKISADEINKKGCLSDHFKNKSLTNLNDSVWDLSERFPDKKERPLFLLPNIDDPTSVDKINWDDEDIPQFVIDLYDKIKSYYSLDFLLIDSRSGFSAPSANSMQTAHRAFSFFRPNSQHRNGILNALGTLQAQGVKVNIVASQVPNIKQSKKFLYDSERLFQKKIDFVLPLNPDFAIGEKLLFNVDDCKDIRSVYDEMVDTIIEDK